MWGRGELRSSDAVRALERAALDGQPLLTRGLEQAGLEQERRSLRLAVGDLVHAWEADDVLLLQFGLVSGAFATTVLRELCEWHPDRAQSGDSTGLGATPSAGDDEPA